MAKDFSTMDNSNPSPTPAFTTFQPAAAYRPARRSGGNHQWSAGAARRGVAGGCSTNAAGRQSALGFKAVAMNDLDAVTVPDGYRVQVLYRWGDAVGIAGNMPAYKPDASNTATEQEAQAGTHHDGIHYFPLDGSQRGLLVTNHEYTDDGLLHVGGMQHRSADKAAKAQAASGCLRWSRCSIAVTAGSWCALALCPSHHGDHTDDHQRSGARPSHASAPR